MIRTIANKLGVDKTIFFTSVTRFFQAGAGIMTVLLVASFMSATEQGFYYTFGSILAIQVFFELGLSGILTQFVAHENARLQINGNVLSGSSKHISRLSDLLHFCLEWYAIIAGLVLVVLYVVGFVFFTTYYKSEEIINWQLPWFLLVLGTTLNFMIAPISSYLEGLGKVKDIALIRLVQSMVAYPIVWILLVGGAKLYAAMVIPLVGFLVFTIFGWKKFGKLLVNIYREKIVDRVSYVQEIFPYQWKIALSWISGYFIFQLFNPVLFAYEGAVVAGQMGMTLTVLNSIGGLSLSWITTKVPVLSGYIARREYRTLDSLFNRTIKQQMFIVSSLLLSFLGGVFLLRTFDITVNNYKLSNRLLPYIPMILMMITVIINQYIGSIAVYLRCHKREPFMIYSIVCGLCCVLSTIIFGKNFGVLGVTIGYCIITITCFPWCIYIYQSKKKEWHGDKT